MINLNPKEQEELWNLRNKIVHGAASSSDMRRFLELMLKSSQDNRLEIERHLRLIGYFSIEEFQKALEKKDNKELTNFLLIVGGAILIGIVLKRLSKK